MSCRASAKSAGREGEYAARAKAGDFIHVPAFLPHMEINRRIWSLFTGWS